MSDVGRPSDFTQEMADRICDWLIIGKSLTSFCKESNTPTLKTVYNWLEKHPTFLQQYMRARDIQADVRVDMMMDIADSQVNDQIELRQNELRIDTIKWTASKIKPKKYGNLVQTEDVTQGSRKLVIVTTDKDIETNGTNNHLNTDDRE
jgi:hypothetical protein